MLYLLFHVGGERYAMEATRVVEVIPLVDVRPLPQAPPGIRGILTYRGRPIPALDLTELALGRPAERSLSTRIFILNYADRAGGSHLLGLVAERATEMVRREPGEFVDTGLKLPAAPYLGPVLIDGEGTIQRLEAQRLLSEPVRELMETLSREVVS
jgi:chemotaxis-related protein WspB